MKMKKEDEKDLYPPHIETYQKLGEYVYVSDLHQGTERTENIRLATFLAEKTNEPVFILPHIQPLEKNSELRKEYLPNGVKKDKNPDFYFRGRFVDGKNMTGVKFTDDVDKQKDKIQNRLKDAFKQANDILLEISTSYEKKVILSAVKGKLKSSKHFHIVYVKHGNDLFVIKTKKPD